MVLEGPFAGACRTVPEPYRPIVRSRRENPAVRREGNGSDPAGMALERPFAGACRSVPEPYLLVVRRRENPAVWREGSSSHPATNGDRALSSLYRRLS